MMVPLFWLVLFVSVLGNVEARQDDFYRTLTYNPYEASDWLYSQGFIKSPKLELRQDRTEVYIFPHHGVSLFEKEVLVEIPVASILFSDAGDEVADDVSLVVELLRRASDPLWKGYMEQLLPRTCRVGWCWTEEELDTVDMVFKHEVTEVQKAVFQEIREAAASRGLLAPSNAAVAWASSVVAERGLACYYKARIQKCLIPLLDLMLSPDAVRHVIVPIGTETSPGCPLHTVQVGAELFLRVESPLSVDDIANSTRIVLSSQVMQGCKPVVAAAIQSQPGSQAGAHIVPDPSRPLESLAATSSPGSAWSDPARHVLSGALAELLEFLNSRRDVSKRIEAVGNGEDGSVRFLPNGVKRYFYDPNQRHVQSFAWTKVHYSLDVLQGLCSTGYGTLEEATTIWNLTLPTPRGLPLYLQFTSAAAIRAIPRQLGGKLRLPPHWDTAITVVENSDIFLNEDQHCWRTEWLSGDAIALRVPRFDESAHDVTCPGVGYLWLFLLARVFVFEMKVGGLDAIRIQDAISVASDVATRDGRKLDGYWGMAAACATVPSCDEAMRLMASGLAADPAADGLNGVLLEGDVRLISLILPELGILEQDRHEEDVSLFREYVLRYRDEAVWKSSPYYQAMCYRFFRNTRLRELYEKASVHFHANWSERWRKHHLHHEMISTASVDSAEWLFQAVFPALGVTKGQLKRPPLFFFDSSPSRDTNASSLSGVAPAAPPDLPTAVRPVYWGTEPGTTRSEGRNARGKPEAAMSFLSIGAAADAGCAVMTRYTEMESAAPDAGSRSPWEACRPSALFSAATHNESALVTEMISSRRAGGSEFFSGHWCYHQGGDRAVGAFVISESVSADDVPRIVRAVVGGAGRCDVVLLVPRTFCETSKCRALFTAAWRGGGFPHAVTVPLTNLPESAMHTLPTRIPKSTRFENARWLALHVLPNVPSVNDPAGVGQVRSREHTLLAWRRSLRGPRVAALEDKGDRVGHLMQRRETIDALFPLPYSFHREQPGSLSEAAWWNREGVLSGDLWGIPCELGQCGRPAVVNTEKLHGLFEKARYRLDALREESFGPVAADAGATTERTSAKGLLYPLLGGRLGRVMEELRVVVLAAEQGSSLQRSAMDALQEAYQLWWPREPYDAHPLSTMSVPALTDTCASLTKLVIQRDGRDVEEGWGGAFAMSAGERARFVVVSYDWRGIRKTDGGDAFYVRLEGASILVPTVHDLGDGRYEFFVQTWDAGVYDLIVRLDFVDYEGTVHCHIHTTDTTILQPIMGSPFKVLVYPDAEAQMPPVPHPPTAPPLSPLSPDPLEPTMSPAAVSLPPARPPLGGAERVAGNWLRFGGRWVGKSWPPSSFTPSDEEPKLAWSPEEASWYEYAAEVELIRGGDWLWMYYDHSPIDDSRVLRFRGLDCTAGLWVHILGDSMESLMLNYFVLGSVAAFPDEEIQYYLYTGEDFEPSTPQCFFENHDDSTCVAVYPHGLVLTFRRIIEPVAAGIVETRPNSHPDDLPTGTAQNTNFNADMAPLAKRIGKAEPDMTFVGFTIHYAANGNPLSFVTYMRSVLMELRKTFSGPLIWRRSGATDFSKSYFLHEYHRCRTTHRLDVLDAINMELAEEYGMPVLDYYTVTQGRERCTCDNRHHVDIVQHGCNTMTTFMDYFMRVICEVGKGTRTV